MPVSVRGCLIVHVPSLLFGWESSSVGGCLHLWLVMGGCQMVLMVEGVGGHCRWALCHGSDWWHGWVVALVAVVDR